ncbi:MAG: prepilin-type N-terminal cleavage/methylation domain-containing protein [Brachymonas sp.]|nr:prepilin-type N-terminal cleavage/methylation domain-containing protein [Brachymonas sp.]
MQAAKRSVTAGFTLIEVMVAMAILALVAVLSWRGLDAMVRVRERTGQASAQIFTLQTALAQWRADLDAMLPEAHSGNSNAPSESAIASPLAWDGKVLRLLRRANATLGADNTHLPLPTGGAKAAPAPAASEGTQVVVWALGACTGLQPDPATATPETAATPCWLRWQSPVLRTLGDQQLAWQQAEAWGQHAGRAAHAMGQTVMPVQQWQLQFFREGAWAPAPATSLPDAVRLVLNLPAKEGLQGDITVDWMSPTLARQRQ